MPHVSVNPEKTRPLPTTAGTTREPRGHKQREQPTRRGQRAGGNSHLTLQREACPAAHDREPTRHPAPHATLEQVEMRHPRPGQRRLRLSGALTRLADEDHRRVDRADLRGMLAEGIERNVVRTSDMRRCVFTMRAYVEQSHAGMGVQHLCEIARPYGRFKLRMRASALLLRLSSRCS